MGLVLQSQVGHVPAAKGGTHLCRVTVSVASQQKHCPLLNLCEVVPARNSKAFELSANHDFGEREKRWLRAECKREGNVRPWDMRSGGKQMTWDCFNCKIWSRLKDAVTYKNPHHHLLENLLRSHD